MAKLLLSWPEIGSNIREWKTPYSLINLEFIKSNYPEDIEKRIWEFKLNAGIILDNNNWQMDLFEKVIEIDVSNENASMLSSLYYDDFIQIAREILKTPEKVNEILEEFKSSNENLRLAA